MILKRGYMYWADVRPGFGTEPGKKRPVVVLQSDLLNQVPHNSTIVAICTSVMKPESILRVHIPATAAGNRFDTAVLIDQCQALDNRRFISEMGEVPPLFMKEIKRKLAVLLDYDYATSIT